jgi:hypothetical protein
LGFAAQLLIRPHHGQDQSFLRRRVF